MRRRSKTIIGGLVLLVFAAFSASAMAAPSDEHVATVTVYKQVSPTGVVYTYSVTNNSKYPILAVSIGFDHYQDTSELSGAIPTDIRGPANWTGEVITVEESDDFELRWEPNGQDVLLPGQTVTELRVGMGKEDDRYVNSHWTVYINDPMRYRYASSLLKLVDPPPNKP